LTDNNQHRYDDENENEKRKTHVCSVHGVEALFSFKFLDLVIATGTGERFGEQSGWDDGSLNI